MNWEAQLLAYGTERLSRVEGFRMIGTATYKAGVMTFVLGDIHANDVGTIVDLHGVAIPHRSSLRHARSAIFRPAGDSARIFGCL